MIEIGLRTENALMVIHRNDKSFLWDFPVLENRKHASILIERTLCSQCQAVLLLSGCTLPTVRSPKEQDRVLFLKQSLKRMSLSCTDKQPASFRERNQPEGQRC